MRILIALLMAAIAPLPALPAGRIDHELDALFGAYSAPHSPGCSVGVIRDGNFVFRKSYGEASLELDAPLTPESVFYMASVSKQFTAAAIVLAAQQHFLSLDDDVRKYIPELPDYGHPITLRQMLHHTSGFRDFLALTYLAGRDISALSSPVQALELIARQTGLNNEPGAEFVYSNSNYFLLGVALQRATGKSLAQFAATNIFQPLGMTHTRFYDDHTVVVPHRAAAYDPGKDGKFLVDWSTIFDIVGSGGLMSNVDDLLLWDRNFYSGKIGEGALASQLATLGVLNSGHPINYGLGLWLGEYRGLRTVEHSGGTFGYRTELLRFPQQRFSAVILCNIANADVEGLARRIADLYLEKQLKPAAIPSQHQAFPDPAAFAGTYLDPRTHMIYTFTASNGDLMAWGAKLGRISENQFSDLVGNPIVFQPANGAMTATLTLQGETYFSGSKTPEIHLNDAVLSQSTGHYHSDELDANYSLSLQDGILNLSNGRDNPPVKLKPVASNEFQAGDLGTIVFRNEAGYHVSSLTLFSQSARGISFRKID